MHGSSAACSKMVEAYYKYEGIDSYVSKYTEMAKKSYPKTSAVIPFATAVYQRQFQIPIYHDTYLKFRVVPVTYPSGARASEARWSLTYVATF